VPVPSLRAATASAGGAAVAGAHADVVGRPELRPDSVLRTDRQKLPSADAKLLAETTLPLLSAPLVTTVVPDADLPRASLPLMV
jgi:hypothetical protein